MHGQCCKIFAGSLLVVLLAAPAFAHIDLLEPEARAHGTAARGDTEIDVNSNLKSGPCGQLMTGRTDRVATYAPGQSITVRVREENAHVSYIRVRIDLDGESFPVRAQAPAAPETEEQALAAERALGEEGLLAVVRENNDTAGFVHEIPVTLPDATCDNCTLQVAQFMYDDPAAPHYFQCADLVLAELDGPEAAPGDAGPAPQGGGAGASAPVGVGTGTAAGVDATATGSAMPGSGAPAAAAPAMNSSTNGPATAPPVAAATPSNGAGGGGCSLSRKGEGPSPAATLALSALGLCLLRRHRRSTAIYVPL